MMQQYHAYMYEFNNATSELSLRTYEVGLAPTGLRDLDVVHDADDRPGMWHSQSGQDHTVASILGTAPTGRARFFVDLAANSPVVFSNTRALERDWGWSGICIEGNPHLIAALVGRRRCSVVCTLVDSSVRSVTFDIARHHGNGVSSIRPDASNRSLVHHSSEALTAKTVPLGRILADLRAPPVIDFLSLDVEGFEERVLAGHDFKRHHFLTIAVERPSAVLRAVLLDNGYEHILDHGKYGDEFWILSNRSRLGQAWRGNLRAGFKHSSLDEGDVDGRDLAERTQASYRRWLAVIRSRNWSVRRAGISPITRKKSIYNCCGVPKAWVASGTVPADVGHRPWGSKDPHVLHPSPSSSYAGAMPARVADAPMGGGGGSIEVAPGRVCTCPY